RIGRDGPRRGPLHAGLRRPGEGRPHRGRLARPVAGRAPRRPRPGFRRRLPRRVPGDRARPARGDGLALPRLFARPRSRDPVRRTAAAALLSLVLPVAAGAGDLAGGYSFERTNGADAVSRHGWNASVAVSLTGPISLVADAGG